jgi:hypothetical protein
VRLWFNQPYNFDHLGMAMVSLFVTATLNGYTGGTHARRLFLLNTRTLHNVAEVSCIKACCWTKIGQCTTYKHSINLGLCFVCLLVDNQCVLLCAAADIRWAGRVAELPALVLECKQNMTVHHPTSLV